MGRAPSYSLMNINMRLVYGFNMYIKQTQTGLGMEFKIKFDSTSSLHNSLVIYTLSNPIYQTLHNTLSS